MRQLSVLGSLWRTLIVMTIVLELLSEGCGARAGSEHARRGRFNDDKELMISMKICAWDLRVSLTTSNILRPVG